MTTEIAIMNKSAIALAADSAATVLSGSNESIILNRNLIITFLVIILSRR